MQLGIQVHIVVLSLWGMGCMIDLLITPVPAKAR